MPIRLDSKNLLVAKKRENPEETHLSPEASKTSDWDLSGQSLLIYSFT